MRDGLQSRAREVAAELSRDLLGALLVVRDSGEVLSWNEGAETLFGYEAADIIGRSVFDTIVPPDQAEAKKRSLAAAGASGSTTYEGLRRRADGVLIWVEISARAHQESDGTRLVVLNERDITRIRYQREAHLLQTRFRGVLETGPDAIVLVDHFGRIVLVNSETERLFGYSRSELLGDFVELLVPVRFHKSHPSHRGGYFSNAKTRPMGTGLELSGRKKGGVEFPVEISLSPLTIDDATFAMAAIRDVTGRKRTEEALKAANAELEAFTYSVSHDLRAPIRQIEGFAKLLEEHLGADSLRMDAESARHLKRIREGAQQMGRLVDDLLHLARLGRQDVKPRPVPLAEIIAEIRAALPDTAGREIEWVVGSLPVVVCDPGLMKVAFTNLLSNAVKYTRPKAHAVIELGQVQRNGRNVVYVRDNGVGFDMQYADKLFGVFQRLHRVEEFEGTGVGLATVQRIIRKHGGEIWADARVEEGATFYVAFGAPTDAVA